MKLLALSIDGFRGIQHANIRFRDHDVLIGPNGSGKSTIIDALSLVFARTRLVRDLTEHDFHGSCPQATSRIRIIATLGGFHGNDSDRHHNWFREGRAVPKWWNPGTDTAEPEHSDHAEELCAQIAFAARFDLEELYVETLRYFHDDDSIEDPFLDDAIQQIPLAFSTTSGTTCCRRGAHGRPPLPLPPSCSAGLWPRRGVYQREPYSMSGIGCGNRPNRSRRIRVSCL